MPAFEPTPRGVRQLTDYIKKKGKGVTVYTVHEIKDWGIGAEKVYNSHTFDNRQPITGIWQAGTDSAGMILARSGRVYTEPPRNMRFIGDPAPQVAGPLGHGNTGDHSTEIDEGEIRGLMKRLRGAPDPRTRRV
ncbi:hypothetical protein [Streptomyces sp. NPDC088794]|uniref:hypothetical protein n=1 Tax=Streptomyces sp. NPDC088794 TaxID=3365902 RepID=UPI0038077B75